ncbi:MAG: cadherin-like beta sandwich domain-containing protein [Nitrospira sp.]|nr:cadherin-like beta sandwich domain-containing protein [Nitrospira sp.]
MKQAEKSAAFMERFSTVVRPYLAISLLIATGLSAHGCGDSATVNPVVELASLSVDPGTLQPAFSGGTTQYSVDLTSSTTTVTVSAQPAVSGDSVTINGQATTSRVITLDPPGSTTVVDISVSESNTSSRAYTVRLVRAGLAGNNSLQSLAVSPGTLAPDFDPNTLAYTSTVASNVGSVTVTCTVQDSNATMTVNGQAATSGQARAITLNGPGQNTTITVTVTGQNGNPKTYFVAVSRGVSNNNNLQGLTISQGTLSPAFRASTTDYTVEVASSVASVGVTPRLQDSDASMTVNGQATSPGQTRTIQLGTPNSTTSIIIIVTAQDGTQKAYTVTVIKAALGGNNNLQSLAVSPGSLDPAFSENTTRYTLNVGSGATGVRVTAILQDTSGTLEVNQQGTPSGQVRTIDLGAPGSTTEVEILAIAPNGNSKRYIVTVNRAAPSADNHLSALTATPGILDPDFTAGTLNYTVDVATDVTSVTVSATKSDPDAVISGDVPNQGEATVQLDGPGTSKDVSVIVTAANGSSKTYRLTVNRAAPSADNNLSALTVSSGVLFPAFAPGRLTYTVTIPSSVRNVTVTATKSDPNAVMAAFGSVIAAAGTPTGQVTVSLGIGTSSSIAITVTAPNGSAKTYRLLISRPFR